MAALAGHRRSVGQGGAVLGIVQSQNVPVGDEDDNLDDNNDRRGWWGDTLDADTTGDQIGSRLWLLDRAKTTQDNINNCKIYAEEALQWLIDDEVCADVKVTVERYGIAGNDRLALKIEVLKKDGTTETVKYNDVWDAQFA